MDYFDYFPEIIYVAVEINADGSVHRPPYLNYPTAYDDGIPEGTVFVRYVIDKGEPPIVGGEND